MGMMTRRNVKHRAVEKTALAKTEDKKVEEVKKDDFSQYMNAPVETTEVQYTKTEINRMSTADLKELALKNGVKNADEMSGGDIKKELIKRFGL